jgi:hypothetical protein
MIPHIEEGAPSALLLVLMYLKTGDYASDARHGETFEGDVRIVH